MKRGIYIMASDPVAEQTIALLNSIRHFDKETEIIIIPYSRKCRKIAGITRNYDRVSMYGDQGILKRILRNLNRIFGRRFFARPNQFLKQACWFGPFDEFLYLDTDIIVFEKVIDNLKYLKDYDFICCDYQRNTGIENVFTPRIIEEGAITEKDIKHIFNAGFWGSKKGLISEEKLYETFKECARRIDYFDFSQKVSDMPIINYLVLKNIPRKANITELSKGRVAGNWAGSSRFERKGNILVDPDSRSQLKYLHWAGIKIEDGCPYWEIWENYKNLDNRNARESKKNKVQAPIKYRVLRWLHKNLAKRKLFVRLANSVIFNCREIIHQHLSSPSAYLKTNGEGLLIETIGPHASVFFDVGANRGKWTGIFLKHSNKSVKGFLYEPSVECNNMLKDKFKEKKNVFISNSAVGASIGERIFYELPNLSTCSSLVPIAKDNAIKRHVQTTTLDYESKKHSLEYIDFVKIDTEGYDMNVMKGAQELISKQKIGIIQFEYHRSWASSGSTLKYAINFLKSFGYKVFLLKAQGLFNLRYNLYGEYFHTTNFVAISPKWNWVIDKLFAGDI